MAATVPNVLFGTFDTPLGVMLVAATARGVCHVAFGDDAEALEHSVRKEFPGAVITNDRERVEPWARQVAAGLTPSGAGVEVPLDVHGTPFQHQVWAELRRIVPGTRRSYQEVAASIGRPTAVRAVARACATNPVAVVVPCHRVVRGDGTLGGFRWGLHRKKALLDAERPLAETSRPRNT